MVVATSLLQLMLSILIVYQSVANGVLHSSTEKKNVLYLNNIKVKQQHPRSCISQKSSNGNINGATILEMKHRYYDKVRLKDRTQLIMKRLNSDTIRVQSLQSRIRNAISNEIEHVSEAEIPLSSGIKLQTLNYIVTVELGGRNLSVIVDTGSDLTWVQCQPCKTCYNQQDPLFNPSVSPSYQSIECNSQTCQSLQFATGNSGVCGTASSPTCDYFVSYGDGSYTRGELARDRITLGGTPVEGFIFGCGRNNRGLFGGASGLMGLGRSNLSLVSQSFPVFGGVFSYCLPDSDSDISGSLIFGNYSNSTPISYTAMLQNPQLSEFYLLNLTAISIGGLALPVWGTDGVLIDSGTVISRIPPSMYRAMKAEFVKQFSGFPSAPGFSILDTCYNLSGYKEVNIPTVTLHFDGNAELEVDVSGVFYFVKSDASQVCLAIASLTYEDEIPIIGNYQQRNTRVVYDTKESRLGFVKETCGFM